jgi:hypothetical protein
VDRQAAISTAKKTVLLMIPQIPLAWKIKNQATWGNQQANNVRQFARKPIGKLPF